MSQRSAKSQMPLRFRARWPETGYSSPEATAVQARFLSQHHWAQPVEEEDWDAEMVTSSNQEAASSNQEAASNHQQPAHQRDCSDDGWSDSKEELFRPISSSTRRRLLPWQRQGGQICPSLFCLMFPQTGTATAKNEDPLEPKDPLDIPWANDLLAFFPNEPDRVVSVQTAATEEAQLDKARAAQAQLTQAEAAQPVVGAA